MSRRVLRVDDHDGLFDMAHNYAADAREAVCALFECAAEWDDEAAKDPRLYKHLGAALIALREVDTLVGHIETDEKKASQAKGSHQ